MMSDLREHDFDDRDIDFWDRTRDATVVNDFLKTLDRFDVIDKDFRGSVEGTYFERRYRAQLDRERNRSHKQVQCDQWVYDYTV